MVETRDCSVLGIDDVDPIVVETRDCSVLAIAGTNRGKNKMRKKDVKEKRRICCKAFMALIPYRRFMVLRILFVIYISV